MSYIINSYFKNEKYIFKYQIKYIHHSTQPKLLNIIILVVKTLN